MLERFSRNPAAYVARLTRRAALVCVLGCGLIALGACSTTSAPQARSWTDTWAAVPDSDGPPVEDKTIFQTLRVSVGGDRIRIRFSNLHGSGPLPLGPVIVHAGAGDSAQARHALTFGGKPTVTIPQGGELDSDPVALSVSPLEQLTVGMYLKGPGVPATLHGDARQNALIVPGNKLTEPVDTATAQRDDSRYFISAVSVQAAKKARLLVAIGDSITDGNASSKDRDARWTDALNTRLQADASGAAVAVINAGISGNRLLNDGPVGTSVSKRLQHDVFDREGVRWMLLASGINDIGMADVAATPADNVSDQDVIEAMKHIAARARAKGIAVWGATLTPYSGTLRPLAHTQNAEAKRLRINHWIRTSGTFDRVVDFDQVLSDPARPAAIAAQFDSGDHLHPNDAGYRAMAAAIPTSYFEDR